MMMHRARPGPWSARRLGELSIPLLAAAVLAVVVLRASYRWGRLSSFPRLDNVAYMASGAEWALAMQQGGLRGLIRWYIRDIPHAPYCDLVAGVGFRLFGVADWVPQAMQTLVLAIAFVAAWRLTRPAGLRHACLLLWLVSVVPVWSKALEVFKPDYMAALLTALGCTVAMRPPHRRSTRRLLVSGGLFGLALWAKPVAFPGVLFHAGLGVLTPHLAWRVCRGPKPIRPLARDALAVGIAMTLIAGPHFLIAWREVWHYFHTNAFGPSLERWRFRRGWLEHIGHYVVGGSASVFLGSLRWVVWPMLMALGCLWIRLLRGFGRRVCVAWAILLGGSYLVIVVNRMQIAEFGLTLQFLSLFALAGGLASLVRLERARRGSAMFSTLTIIALGLFASATHTLPMPYREGTRPERRNRLETPCVKGAFDSILASARSVGPQADGRVHVVMCTTPSPLHPALVHYWLLRHGIAPLVTDFVDASNLAADTRELRSADVVVANSGTTGMTSETTFTPGANAAMLAFIQSDARWRSVARIPGLRPHSYFEVFVRRSAPP